MMTRMMMMQVMTRVRIDGATTKSITDSSLVRDSRSDPLTSTDNEPKQPKTPLSAKVQHFNIVKDYYYCILSPSNL